MENSTKDILGFLKEDAQYQEQRDAMFMRFMEGIFTQPQICNMPSTSSNPRYYGHPGFCDNHSAQFHKQGRSSTVAMVLAIILKKHIMQMIF